MTSGNSKPPPVIEHEGWRYRRVGMVGRKPGRPSKKPRVSDDGAEQWYCPCCERWKGGDGFGVDNNASNGLKSWCRDCCREEARMRKAISGTDEPRGYDDE